MAVIAGPSAAEPSVVVAVQGNAFSLSIVQLRRFLPQHRGWHVVATDAAQLHWSLMEALREKNDTKGCEAIGRLSEKLRLLDIGFYEQRLEFARDGRVLLSESSGVSAGEEPRMDDGDSVPVLAASAIARRALSRYLELRGQAEAFLTEVEPDAPARRICLTLGVGRDVQGAIAARKCQQAAPLEFARPYVERLAEVLEERIALSASQLRAHPLAESAFYWRGNLPELTRLGSPRVNPSQLKKWLNSECRNVRLEHSAPNVTVLRDAGAVIATDGIWSDIAACRRALRPWLELTRATRTLTWISQLAPAPRAEPDPLRGKKPCNCTIIPRLTSLEPDWEYLLGLKSVGLVNALQEQVIFLELRQLYLRCWASITKGHGGQPSELAQFFAAGTDPVIALATELRRVVAGDRDFRGEPEALSPVAERLAGWDVSDRRWQTLVNTMMWAIAHGMTTKTLLEPLLEQQVFEGAPVTDTLAHDFLLVFQTIYQDSYKFFADPALHTAAKRLNIDDGELFEIVFDYLDDKTKFACVANINNLNEVNENITITLRKAIEGVGARGLRAKIENRLVKMETGDKAFPKNLRKRLLAGRVQHADQRVGPPTYGIYYLVQQAKDLADAIRKQVAYALTRAEWPLVGMAGDTFLIDRRKAQQHRVIELERMVRAILESRLDDVAAGCPDFRC